MSRIPSQYLPALADAANAHGHLTRAAAIKAIAARVDHATPDGPMVWAEKKFDRYRLPQRGRHAMVEHLYSEGGVQMFELTDHYRWVMRKNDFRAERAVA
jgi:hypothetical protein